MGWQVAQAFSGHPWPVVVLLSLLSPIVYLAWRTRGDITRAVSRIIVTLTDLVCTEVRDRYLRAKGIPLRTRRDMIVKALDPDEDSSDSGSYDAAQQDMHEN